MAIDPTLKNKIKARLRLGATARELSEEFDMSYQTINLWAREIKNDRVDEAVDELLTYSEDTLTTVTTLVGDKAESKKVAALVKDVVGLQRLEEKTRTLSFSILNKVESYLSLTDCDLKELREASNIVTTIHNAMFNKANTQINVLNNNNTTNNISSEKREIFKSNMGA